MSAHTSRVPPEGVIAPPIHTLVGELFSMFKPLQLKAAKPVVTKRRKYIFEHPHDERLLIKVVRKEGTYRKWGLRKYYKRWRRGSVYFDFIRVLKEYILIRASSEGHVPSIPRVFGLIDTDLGLGLVVEKISAPDGRLAPSLIAIVREGGLTADIRERLDALMHELIQHNVVINDLGLTNLVYADDGIGKGRFVLIDGFGDRTYIPIYSMSKILNRWNALRKYRRLLKKSEAISAARVPVSKAASN